jgi:hypothetical protein
MRRPSTVSSATFVRYSCARWIGLRVWKPTTRQPLSRRSRYRPDPLASSGERLRALEAVTRPAR